MPLSAHTSREHWSSDIRSSYWWRSLLLIMVSYSRVRNILLYYFLGRLRSSPVFHSRCSVTAIYTLLGDSLVLPTPQGHCPRVATRSIASWYYTSTSVAQVGLGLGVMWLVFWLLPLIVLGSLPPPCFIALVSFMGFSGISFVFCLEHS